jgi:dodecin
MVALEGGMDGSVYKIIELVGTSAQSWEDAAKTAIETAGKSLEDLRVAEVVKQDVTVEDGKVTSYRVRLNLSFKFRSEKS